ncbi:MAG TPA: APC family permease [Gemmatimonadales bacterium]|nr:APC family permease [Gemmatimonadales bacterium]
MTRVRASDPVALQEIDHSPGLRRALGRWDLTAIGINQVIGVSIFLLPSQIAAIVGAWSPIAVAVVGLTSLSVALCFAELASRFEGTGGPYLYTRHAFGEFFGFEVGWMQWFTRAASQSAVMAGTAVALGYYWPAIDAGWPRVALIVALALAHAWVNVRGIRYGAWVIDALTVAKLLPLAVFIVAGFWYVEPARLTTLPPLTAGQALSGALLLLFMYGGYEVVPVPGGEMIDPRRDVPFALMVTILSVTTVMTLAQAVAQGVLPDLARHGTPVADAAALLLGAGGALLVGVGSIVSMTGNNAGQVLTGARMIFALAEHGQLPGWFGRVHPKHRTPANAVLFTSAVALPLALSGSFAKLAAAAAVSRLIMYAGSAAATLELRRRPHGARPAAFVTPLGPVVPIVAMIVSVAIAFGATREQLLVGATALAAGAALFTVNRIARRRYSLR